MSPEQTTITCRVCGHANPQESSFCRMCGRGLDAPTERLPTTARSSAPPRAVRPSRRAVVGAVATAGAVAVAIGAAAVVVLDSRGTSRAHASVSTTERVTPTVTDPTAGAIPSSAAPPPAGAIQSGWPASVAGFTVALASDKNEADARHAAGQAAHRGLPSVGFLWSSEYHSLRPDYWFVFSGVYDSAAEAADHVAAARAAGFAGAYPRRVAR